MAGSLTKNKKEEFGGCQCNEIQFIKIKHTWLDWIQIEPWSVMAIKPIIKKKKLQHKENLDYITNLLKKEKSCKFWKFYVD